jgi:hypothetical protein
MEHNVDNNTKVASFVRYFSKGQVDNQQEYGSIQKSVWKNGTCKSETLLWLGKVLNKDKMILNLEKMVSTNLHHLT